jgi:hypothetical protein
METTQIYVRRLDNEHAMERVRDVDAVHAILATYLARGALPNSPQGLNGRGVAARAAPMTGSTGSRFE